MLYVGGDKINQIYIGPNTTIKEVYYGRQLVWSTEAVLERNTPITKTIYLNPGVYEVYAVGGGGGSASSGGGGSGNQGDKNEEAIGGS